MRLQCRHGRRAGLQQRGDGIWRLRLRRDHDDLDRQRHHDRGDHGHRNGFGLHRFDDHRSQWRWGMGGMASTGSGGSAGGVRVDAGASDGAGGGSAGAGGTSDGGAGYWDGGSDAKVDSGGPMLDPCDACTQSQCASELDACLSDSSCFEGDGSGQYEQVIACVDATRVSQVVKRQDFIDCGNEVGLSGTGWPPVGMTTETTNLMNCIAMGQPNNNSWADSTMRSMVWPTNSCAKLACTAKLQ